MESRAVREIIFLAMGATLLAACAGDRAVRLAPLAPGPPRSDQASGQVSIPTPSIYSPPPPNAGDRVGGEPGAEAPTVEIGGGEPTPAPGESPSSPPSGSDGPVDCGRSEDASVDAIAVKTKTRCFAVHGTTWEEIQRAIHKEGPDVGSVDAVAATKWRISTNYYIIDKDASCDVSRITVGLGITYDYPRVRPDPVGALAGQWRSYMKDEVVPHEEQHGEIALDGARDLLKQLRRLPEETTCDQMRAELARTVDRSVEDTRRKQDAFDYEEYGG